MDLGQEVRVNTRLIRANTAEAFGAAAISLPATNGLRVLQGREPDAAMIFPRFHRRLDKLVGTLDERQVIDGNEKSTCKRVQARSGASGAAAGGDDQRDGRTFGHSQNDTAVVDARVGGRWRTGVSRQRAAEG